MTNRKTLTEVMFETSCPYNNPYQGGDKRVLFVCSAGLLRSATAARIYASKYNTRAAGSAYYALVPVNDALMAWADEIVFVNQHNRDEVDKRYDLEELGLQKKIVVLNIPDDYGHMHPELIESFKEQYEDF